MLNFAHLFLFIFIISLVHYYPIVLHALKYILYFYLQEGVAPINLIIEHKLRRATPGGTVGVKTIGNYVVVRYSFYASFHLYMNLAYHFYFFLILNLNLSYSSMILHKRYLSTQRLGCSYCDQSSSSSFFKFLRSQPTCLDVVRNTVD